MPRPISEAPKDGTVILTDQGIALFIDQRRWGSPMPHGKWGCCDPNGNIFDCADNGDYLCEPKFWEPLPEWINGNY